MTQTRLVLLLATLLGNVFIVEGLTNETTILSNVTTGMNTTTEVPSTSVQVSITTPAGTENTTVPMIETSTSPNGTEESSNATSAIPLSTSISPTTVSQTTATPGNTWVVTNKDDKICQKMQFSGNISIMIDGPLKSVLIPSTSNASGDCSLTKRRDFSLTFIPDEGTQLWILTFVFDTVEASQTYQLTSLAVEFGTGNSERSTYKFVSTEEPLADISAPIGKSFSCDNVRVQYDGNDRSSIALKRVMVQPFAEKAKGDFGQSVTCPFPPTKAPPSPPPKVWMCVGIAFIALFVLSAVVQGAYCFYVKKHKTRPEDTYNLMESNY